MQTTQNTLTVEKTTKTITIAETKNQKFPLSAPATHGKSTIPALWAKQEPTTDTIAETNHQFTKTPQKDKKNKTSDKNPVRIPQRYRTPDRKTTRPKLVMDNGQSKTKKNAKTRHEI